MSWMLLSVLRAGGKTQGRSQGGALTLTLQGPTVMDAALCVAGGAMALTFQGPNVMDVVLCAAGGRQYSGPASGGALALTFQGLFFNGLSPLGHSRRV